MTVAQIKRQNGGSARGCSVLRKEFLERKGQTAPADMGKF